MDGFDDHIQDVKNSLVLCVDDDTEKLLKNEKVIDLMMKSWQKAIEHKFKNQKQEKQNV